MNKSNIAITRIRTGNGDNGDTKLCGGKDYRKAHPVVAYTGSLDTAQAFTTALPRAWGDFEPRTLAQEVLFRLGAVMGSRKPKDQELALQELSAHMEKQIEFISGGLVALDSFIRVDERNAELQQLRAFVRAAEVAAVAAHDYTQLEAKETSENIIYMLKISSAVLNVFSDWVFAFVWLMSTEENGRVPTALKWVPIDEEKLRSLNDG
jgi:cob(I)alamin adenosyltransferase